MPKHIVSVKDLALEPIQQQLAGSFGMGSKKSLDVEINLETKKIWYLVCNQGALVLKTRDLQKAVDLYNSFD